MLVEGLDGTPDRRAVVGVEGGVAACKALGVVDQVVEIVEGQPWIVVAVGQIGRGLSAGEPVYGDVDVEVVPKSVCELLQGL